MTSAILDRPPDVPTKTNRIPDGQMCMYHQDCEECSGCALPATITNIFQSDDGEEIMRCYLCTEHCIELIKAIAEYDKIKGA